MRIYIISNTFFPGGHTRKTTYKLVMQLALMKKLASSILLGKYNTI